MNPREEVLGTSLPKTTTINVVENITLEYDYDYESSVSTLPLFELVPVAILYGITLLLGVAGNALVIFSIAHYRRMRTLTNIFLLSLASADLMLIVLCVPIKEVIQKKRYAINTLHHQRQTFFGIRWNLDAQEEAIYNYRFATFFAFTWQFGEVMCKSVYYLQNVSAICSVTTLTVMSVERYYAIIYPMKAKYVCTASRARKAILFIWVISFLLASPIIIGRSHQEVGFFRKGYWCIKEWSTKIIDKVYEFYMMSIILLIPVAVMSFAYASICKELWVVSHNRTAMRDGQDNIGSCKITSNGSENVISETDSFYKSRIKMTKTTTNEDKTRKQVIKMLVLVIVLFVICWLPILTNNVLVACGHLPALNVGYLKPMREVFYLMAYSNSCVNPVVYGFMSKNFREAFIHALCSCIRGKEYMRRLRFERHNSSVTRSTQMGYIKEIKLEDIEMCSKYGSTYGPDNV